jgi:hypothetical protein
MFVLRLLAILALIGVGGGFVAYALTRDRRYLSFSWTLLKYGVIFALIVFALLILERFGVAVIPL